MTPVSSSLLGDVPTTTDLSELLPAGAIIPFASDPGSPPTGFEFCRGQLISKASVPNLNAIIGDGPGVGNPGYHAYNNGSDPGSGNLRLPNAQNASFLGAGPTSGVAKGGASGGVLDGARPHSHGPGSIVLPAHTHTSGTLLAAIHGHGHTFSMGDHDHSTAVITKAIYSGGKGTMLTAHYTSSESGANTLGFGGSVTNAGTIAVTGSTASSSTVAASGTSATDDGPYLVMNFLIKK